jgi:hypothetical protein
MRRWIWASLEGLLGFTVSSFLAAWVGTFLLGIPVLRENLALLQIILLISVITVGSIFGVVFARRALQIYDGRRKTGDGFLVGKGGKPHMTFASAVAFTLCLLAWAFWILVFQASESGH